MSALSTADRVLVTGGAGFIGSHLTDALLRSGKQVIVLDNFSSGLRENVSEHAELIEGDILDPQLTSKAARGCQLIFHQSAQLEITTSMASPVVDLRQNTEGSLNVFEAARSNDVERVIHASSACVYGQAHRVPQTESDPPEPNWPYGVSKLAVEHYARLYWEMHQISSVGLRYSIVYGPREWYGRVLTIFLKRLLAGEAPVVFGAGDQLRDFVSVRDVVKANLAAAEANIDGAPAVNVSTGVGTSIKELAEQCCSLSERSVDPEFEDVTPGQVSKTVQRMRLPQELQRMVLDPALAGSLLGWEAEVSLSEGLPEELEWLRANPHRWREMSY